MYFSCVSLRIGPPELSGCCMSLVEQMTNNPKKLGRLVRYVDDIHYEQLKKVG